MIDLSLKAFFLDRFFFRKKKTVRLGSVYGGWIIPEGVLESYSICYSAGAGEDISFDVELVKKYDCDVYIFDPTPRAFQHFETLKQKIKTKESMEINNQAGVYYAISQPQLDKLRFYPIGLFNGDGVQKFYQPQNPSHVSHSILNLQKTEKFFEAECKSVATLMRQFGHAHIDLLKMDIEGAEETVLENLLEAKIYPTILCVEFDIAKAKPEDKIEKRWGKKLEKLGYKLIAQERLNRTFLRESFKS